MEHFLILSPLVLYFLATLVYLARLLVNRPVLGFVGLRLVVLGVGLQIAQFVHRTWSLGQLPFLEFFDFFRFAALSLAVIFVGLCIFKKYYATAPLFVISIDILYLFSLTYQNSFPLTGHNSGGAYLFIHIVSLFLTMVAFWVVLITAVLYLVAENKIHNKEFSGWMAKLPPLNELESLNDTMTTLAFVLLTLVIVTGAGYAKITQGHYLTMDFKQWGAVVVWGYFACVTNLRQRLGLLGRRGALWALCGGIGMGVVFAAGF